MDEIDSIGSTRTDSQGGENEVQRTMMELLNQLDGFEPSNRIKIIMATNRIDILDPALLRPVALIARSSFRIQTKRFVSDKKTINRDDCRSCRSTAGR